MDAPPSTCHPERTRISYFTAPPAATYAALRKESRTESTEATVLDRKSGGGEGPAVRPGSHTEVSVPLVLTQNRHPERSASQIDRVTQRSWRGVEGPRRAYPTHAARSFSTTEPAPLQFVRRFAHDDGSVGVQQGTPKQVHPIGRTQTLPKEVVGKQEPEPAIFAL